MKARDKTLLDVVQTRIAELVIAREEARRSHLVVALSGAHAYGFPSPDSDLDLKAIHIAPTEALLGFGDASSAPDRLEIIDGVEIDYTSNEIGLVLRGLITGNGNYAERILGAPILFQAPELNDLIPLAERSISKRIYRHYKGFANSQLEEVKSAKTVTVKSVLYVLRTALSGVHALKTGQIEPDLSALAEGLGFAEAAELIERKRAGERSPLEASDRERWTAALMRAMGALEEAFQQSALPETAQNAPELEAWLIELRRNRLVSGRSVGST